MRNVPQIAFEFIPNKSFLQDDFITSSCNIDAFRMVSSWPRLWPSQTLLVSGEKRSGKTFLAKIWQEASNAKFIDIKLAEKILSSNPQKPENFILEDIEYLLPLHEETIFHLFNKINLSKGYLLITSSKPLISLDIKLPDLKSRIGSSGIVNIMQPDNDLLKGIIFKQFSDLQMVVSPSVIEYIVPRVERSFESISKIVFEINKKSFETKRNITIPFVKEILGL